jgi:hypothetical protein
MPSFFVGKRKIFLKHPVFHMFSAFGQPKAEGG